MARLQIVAGDRDITDVHDGLTFSNVDPGGYEQLGVNPDLIDGLRAGAPVVVRSGSDIAFYGRVNEPGPQANHGRITNQLGVVGAGAILSDSVMRRLYVHEKLSDWVDERSLLGYDASTYDSGGVVNQLQAAGQLAIGHAKGYTAQVAVTRAGIRLTPGEGLKIKQSIIVYSTTAVTAGTARVLYFTDNITGAKQADGGAGTSAALWATNHDSADYLNLQQQITGAPTVLTLDELSSMTLARVFGERGWQYGGASILTPDLVVRDALKFVVGALQVGRIDAVPSSLYAIRHLVYATDVPPQQVIDDMAKLMGYSWGVWEPRSVLDSEPTFHWGAPPADATCSVNMGDCDNVDIPKVRLDQLYDKAIVGYVGADGIRGTVTVTLANPLLYGDVPSRTVTLDGGLSSAAAARVFGNYALALMQRAARGAGSITLPEYVRIPGGGVKPACLLKAGRDRIRIMDLPDSGPMHETDSRRYDTFHVRRVDTSVNPDGSLATRVDFDGGADLLEVLNARKAITDVITAG